MLPVGPCTVIAVLVLTGHCVPADAGDIQPATHHRLAEGGETDSGIDHLLGIGQIATDFAL